MNEAWQAAGLGLTMGLAGSLHCAGMCGVLSAQNPRLWGQVPYHAARGVTYLALFWLLALAGLALRPLQTALAVLAVVFSAVVGLQLLGWLPWKGTTAWGRRLAAALDGLKGFPPPLKGLAVGFVNGFVPCHLVYAAIAIAASLTLLWHGVIFMAAFTLGTSPLLAAVGLGWGSLHRRFGVLALRRATAVMLLLVGGAVGVRAGVKHAGHGGHDVPLLIQKNTWPKTSPAARAPHQH